MNMGSSKNLYFQRLFILFLHAFYTRCTGQGYPDDWRPPTIERGPPRGVLYFDPEDQNYNTTTLSCLASGVPQPAYEWRVNGMVIPRATRASLTVGDYPGPGIYQCLATNQLGTAISNTTHVVRAERKVGELEDQSAREGEPFKLPCPVSILPADKFEWEYYKGSYLTIQDSLQKGTSKLDGSLYFANISAKDSGTYRCGGKSLHRFKMAEVKLTVSKASNVPYNTRSKAIVTPARVAQVNSYQTLQCFCSGTCTDIRWTKITKNGGEEMTSHRGPSIELGPLRLENSAKYRCHIYHNGRKQAYGDIQLVVKEPVRIEQKPKPEIVRKGQDVTFHCQGQPYTHTSWFQNGKEIKRETEGFTLSGSSLLVSTSEVKNFYMTITCNVSDDLTYETADTYLIIRDAVPYSKVPTDQSMVDDQTESGGFPSLLIIVIAVVIVVVIGAVGVLVACMIRELRKSNNSSAGADESALQKTASPEEDANKENERRREGQEQTPLIKQGNNSPIIIVVPHNFDPAPQPQPAGDNGEDSGIE